MVRKNNLICVLELFIWSFKNMQQNLLIYFLQDIVITSFLNNSKMFLESLNFWATLRLVLNNEWLKSNQRLIEILFENPILVCQNQNLLYEYTWGKVNFSFKKENSIHILIIFQSLFIYSRFFSKANYSECRN